MGDMATDSYHRFDQDIAIMKKLGVRILLNALTNLRFKKYLEIGLSYSVGMYTYGVSC